LNLRVILASAIAIPAATAQNSDTPQVEKCFVWKEGARRPLATEVKAWTSRAEQPQWLGYAYAQMGRDERCAAEIMAASGEMVAGIAAWKIVSTE